MKTLYAFIIIAALVAGIITLAPVPPVHAQGATCNQTATVSMASGTTIVVVSGAGGGQTFVCGFVLTADTLATTAQFKFGTGTLCGTGTTNLGGAMRFCDECNIPFARDTPIWQVSNPGTATATPDFCLTSATGALTGFVVYGKYQ